MRRVSAPALSQLGGRTLQTSAGLMPPIALVLVILGVLLAVKNARLSEVADISAVTLGGALLLSIGSACIIARPHSRSLAALIAGVAVLLAIAFFGEQYLTFSWVGARPAPAAAWIAYLAAVCSIIGLQLPRTFFLLLFPDGRLPSSPRRALAWSLLTLTAVSGLLAGLGAQAPNSTPLGERLGIMPASQLQNLAHLTTLVCLVAFGPLCLVALYRRQRSIEAPTPHLSLVLAAGIAVAVAPVLLLLVAGGVLPLAPVRAVLGAAFLGLVAVQMGALVFAPATGPAAAPPRRETLRDTLTVLLIGIVGLPLLSLYATWFPRPRFAVALIATLAGGVSFLLLRAPVSRAMSRLAGQWQERRGRAHDPDRWWRNRVHEIGDDIAPVRYKLDGFVNELSRAAAGPTEVDDLVFQLEHLSALVNAVEAEISDVVSGRQRLVETLGLADAVKQRAAAIVLPDGPVDVAIDPEADVVVPLKVKEAAYFIICGALANVIHHAKARRARATVTFGSGFLLIEVQDNGRGLPPNYEPGIGVRLMRDRASQVGGTCVVSTSPRGGTVVQASLPLGAR